MRGEVFAETSFRVAAQHGYQQVALKYAGGEASLHLERVVEIHRYAQQLASAAGISLRGVILSNGVALKQKALEQIDSLGLNLMISLDGPAAVHDAQRPRLGGQGSFAAVRASILRAYGQGIPLTVSITVMGRCASSHRLTQCPPVWYRRGIHLPFCTF